MIDFIILFLFRVLLLLCIILIDVVWGHFFSSRAATSRQNHCQNNGGTCEPMFGCLLNQGYMSGACGGFLQVCCIQPSFQSRRFKENSIFGSGPPPVRIKSAQKVRKYLIQTCADFMVASLIF